MVTTWTDLLFDWAHDAGAPVCWGTLAGEHWMHVQMPDKTVEHKARTRDGAAWACMAELEPDPLDAPEA